MNRGNNGFGRICVSVCVLRFPIAGNVKILISCNQYDHWPITTINHRHTPDDDTHAWQRNQFGRWDTAIKLISALTSSSILFFIFFCASINAPRLRIVLT